MRDRWVGKNVDFDGLVELVKQFFEKNHFKIITEKQPSNYRIIASPKNPSSPLKRLEVIIQGEPNDFTVEFGTTGSTKNINRWGHLIFLLGGGRFVCESLKFQEELDRLEEKFWNYIDAKLPSLERENRS